ncbi:MAG: TraR/DksA family transcriptional regulator [Ectothiorhodospiraceae bacterium]|jgi:RNA polymerase-binding protein DksA
MTERLSDEAKRELHAKLESEYRTLREEIRTELLAADTERYSDLADLVHDPGDSSVADLLVDLEYAELDRHVESLRGVENALQRLAQGTYGACVDCGEVIALARLQANPAAARCIDCQRRYEHERDQDHPPRL